MLAPYAESSATVEVKRALITSAQALQEVAADVAFVDAIAQIITTIEASYINCGKLLLCGNGGSMADALHIAAEFVGRFRRMRQPYAAIVLGADPARLTAIGNDYGFEQVFFRELQAIGRKGDCLLALSTSGNSKNVIAAVELANLMGLQTAAITGGGELGKCAQVAAIVNAPSVALVQEVTMATAHAICAAVEARLEN